MKAPKHETCFKLAVFKQRHDEFLPRPHIYGLEIIINVRCQLKICNFKVTMDVLHYCFYVYFYDIYVQVISTQYTESLIARQMMEAHQELPCRDHLSILDGHTILFLYVKFTISNLYTLSFYIMYLKY